MKILAVRIGNKYGPEYETYLQNKLPEYDFIWVREPINSEVLFQWNKMRGMNLDIDEPICVIDIDILLVNDYKKIFEYPINRGEFLAMPGWWRDTKKEGYKINGGFFKYYPKDCKYIYDKFMSNISYWQSYYIEKGITAGPVNGEQYFVEDSVKEKLILKTIPDSWVTRWVSNDLIIDKTNEEWQANLTKKYKDLTGNQYIYLGGEFHDDIKIVHFTHSINKPNEWKDYKNFNKKMLSHHSIEKDFTEETGIEWFCPEPYGNIYTETTGEYKACCTGAEFYEVTTDTHTPIEAMNCAKAKELRNAFIQKDEKILSSHCRMCQVQEKSGIKSSRQFSMEHYIDNHKAFDSVVKMAQEVKKNPKKKIRPEYFHTMEHLNGGGNFCNLKCLMCHPYKSSSFASEALELGEDISVFNVTKPLIKPTANERVNDEIQNYILQRLEEIKFTGGEPLQIPYTYILLEKAVELKCSYKQHLRIITNGTIIPKIKNKNIFDYIPHFKYVTINISMEAWGKRNNYIRYPSNFDEILDNANQLANSFPNVSVSFVSTINSLNIGYVDDFFTYPPIVNKKFRSPVMSSYVLKWEDLKTDSYHGMNISSLPYDIREKYLNRFYTLESDMALKIRPYIKILENRDHNMDDTKILISRLKKRDKLRNTNLLELWPEWKKYYV